MAYMPKINNLYKPETARLIFMFKEVFCLEKIDGTNCMVKYVPEENCLKYLSGCIKHETFKALFNEEILLNKFKELFPLTKEEVQIFGEGYSGKVQGMSETYGKELSFIAFEVKIGDTWLSVPKAEEIVLKLGLEFVPYTKTSTDLASLDFERDKPSEISVRRGIVGPKLREGIVIRPLEEFTLNNGARVIAKHKGAAFAETRKPRNVETDPEKMRVLEEANEVADEWMTEGRIHNALSHFPEEKHDVKYMGEFLEYLVNDVHVEGEGEIVFSKDVDKALSRKAAQLLKDYFFKVKE